MTLIQSIKHGEGFRGEPYNDHLGFPTIGYGTKLPLTEEEAELILNYRLNDFKNGVDKELYYLNINPQAKDILYEMAYQMGLNGLLKFKGMLGALSEQDYEEASEEMLDSRWASQTPNRAKRLADKMKSTK